MVQRGGVGSCSLVLPPNPQQKNKEQQDRESDFASMRKCVAKVINYGANR